MINYDKALIEVRDYPYRYFETYEIYQKLLQHNIAYTICLTRRRHYNDMKIQVTHFISDSVYDEQGLCRICSARIVANDNLQHYFKHDVQHYFKHDDTRLCSTIFYFLSDNFLENAITLFEDKIPTELLFRI